MVVDTSAVLSILLGETAAERLVLALLSETRPVMSTVSTLETSMMMERRKGPAAVRDWELLAFKANIEPVAFSQAQQTLALDAWWRFGSGRHRAGLSMGDCCAYALAAHRGLPLLCTGEAFARTDIALVDW